nr:uncharacterized protein LOC127338544 [Lolium perenne]
MAMPCVREARQLRRTCVVAQRLRWRGVARRRGGEAVRATGEAARAATLLASGRSMCVIRGPADHRRRTRPAERRTAASITSVRDRVRVPGRAGRGVMEELGVCRRGARWRSRACIAGGEEAQRVSPRKKMQAAASSLVVVVMPAMAPCVGLWRCTALWRRGDEKKAVLFVWRRACSGVRVHEAVAAAMVTRTTTGVLQQLRLWQVRFRG